MTERLELIRNLVRSVLALQHTVGVYFTPDIRTLCSELEEGVAELIVSTGEALLPSGRLGSEEKQNEERAEYASGESPIPDYLHPSHADYNFSILS